MKKRMVLTGIISLLLVFGMILAGCDNGSTSSDSSGGSNGGTYYGGGGGGGGSGDIITGDLYGTYSVTSPSEAVGHTISVGANTWSMTGPIVNSYGTYTLSTDQRTAILYAYDVGGTVGTVYISGTTLTGILNSASSYPGTYTATKTVGGGGGGNPFIGTWYGTAPGPCYISLTIVESTWFQTQTGTVTGSSSGTYTYSYTNASFTVGTVNGLEGYVTVGSIWSASISGTALIASGVVYTKSGGGVVVPVYPPGPAPD
ncbi:hypothetical protein AGMMS49942_02200 [Spirochaetia bacterium]|nr:hypothetical protein AGMMS49942_02200 [Spirochaetia bacterium]